MSLTLLVSVLLAQATVSSGTGLEWMVLTSLALPALVLVWILYRAGRDPSVY